MLTQVKYFFYATATLVGYTVGAGIFALPYVMQRIGFIPALVLFVILGIFSFINTLSLAELMLRTPGRYFFPGLVQKYYGRLGKYAELIATIIGGYGSLLAYIVLGGSFLKNLLDPWLPFSQGFFTIIFLVAGLFFIWKGFEELGAAEIIMLFLLIGTILAISFLSFEKVEVSNYLNVDLTQILPALGVLIFAFDGVGGIFTVKHILNRRRHLIGRTVLFSYILVAILYLFFTTSLVGVFGASISPEAIVGIADVLGSAVEKSALFFGVLAVFSSFLVIGGSMKNCFAVDFKIPKIPAWLLVWVVPLALFFMGINNFIAIISIMGIVFGIINTLVIGVMLRKAKKRNKRKPEFELRFPAWFNYLIALFYLLGLLYELSCIKE